MRRRLFWKIYLTLLASLVAAVVFMGAFFWFVGEAQRDTAPATVRQSGIGPADVTLYAANGTRIAARGQPITLADRDAHRHWGPGHIMQLDLPNGEFALTRFGPPRGVRAWRLLLVILVVAGVVGAAAYPVTALLTRRLERLRSGVALWGEMSGPMRLDERGSDEVALLARTFNVAAGRIEALLASQKALLANASHELRSPLARLRLAVEAGLAKPASASRDEIIRNLAEMDELVDELLLSSRLGHADPRADHRETVDLLGLAAEEAVRYQASVEGDPVEIDGDPVLLRRLIRNLLDNAAKHGRPPIVAEVARLHDGATLTVADAGPGIDPGDRNRIFDPFFRPAGSAETSGGWGLGLALVRQIAQRHDGSVTCEAVPDGGSRFVVRLKRPALSR